MTAERDRRGTAPQPVELEAASAEETREIGRRLARMLRAGDVVVLSGDLGAGKTTLTQGIGSGLTVRGDVTSPTFVISRVHPSLAAGPALVHVDAYRISGFEELDDLDLDQTVESAVTVVEWGDGLADSLAEHLLHVRLVRRRGDDAVAPGRDLADDLDGDEPRTIVVQAVGARWDGVPLRSLLGGTPDSCS